MSFFFLSYYQRKFQFHKKHSISLVNPGITLKLQMAKSRVRSALDAGEICMRRFRGSGTLVLYRARSYPTESRTPSSVLTLPVVSGHGLAHPQDPRAAPARVCASVCRSQSCLRLPQSLPLIMGQYILQVHCKLILFTGLIALIVCTSALAFSCTRTKSNFLISSSIHT